MAGVLTPFGKELRKMRIDRGEILKNMADKLGCTSSYLSGIECGKHSVPADLVARLQELYGLADEEAARLDAARDATLKEERLRLEDTSPQQRDVALLFARAFKELSPEDLKKMQDILSNNRRKST